MTTHDELIRELEQAAGTDKPVRIWDTQLAGIAAVQVPLGVRIQVLTSCGKCDCEMEGLAGYIERIGAGRLRARMLTVLEVEGWASSISPRRYGGLLKRAIQHREQESGDVTFENLEFIEEAVICEYTLRLEAGDLPGAYAEASKIDDALHSAPRAAEYLAFLDEVA